MFKLFLKVGVVGRGRVSLFVEFEFFLFCNFIDCFRFFFEFFGFVIFLWVCFWFSFVEIVEKLLVIEVLRGECLDIDVLVEFV